MNHETIREAFAKVLAEVPNFHGNASMRDTPDRYARFLVETCKPEPFEVRVFNEPDSDSMVVQENIFVSSLCEHHTLPFFGSCTVGYIPAGGRVLGLSKLARVVEHFATGFQIQERIARMTAEFIFKHEDLKPLGVGVSLRMYHTCMSVRGVSQPFAATTVDSLCGVFKDDPQTRAEFLGRVKHTLFQ